MNETEAARILSALRTEYSDTNAAMLRAQQRLSALKKLIEGYVELFPELEANGPASPSTGTEHVSPPVARPRSGSETVLTVMKAAPGKWWTVGGMTSELERRGWLPDSENPANATRAALDRLAATDSAVRKGRGEKSGSVTYSYRPFELEPSPVDTEETV